MIALAPSLVALRAEITARWPGRDTGSDGWIGDDAHQARVSDHNPGDRDLVHALDIDEDIDGTDDEAGTELTALAEHWRTGRDPRIKYVIYEARMYASYTTSSRQAWTWGPYSGTNPHTRHVHLSILSTIPAETDTSPWLPPLEDDDMALTDDDLDRMANRLRRVLSEGTGKGQRTWADTNKALLATAQTNYNRLVALGRKVDALDVDVDEAEIIAGIIAGWPDDQARRFVDQLAARLAPPVA